MCGVCVRVQKCVNSNCVFLPFLFCISPFRVRGYHSHTDHSLRQSSKHGKTKDSLIRMRENIDLDEAEALKEL